MPSGGRAGERTLQLSLIALSEIIQFDAKIAPARPLGRAPAARRERRLRQLPRPRRRRGPHPRGVRRRALRAPEGAQARLRPGQRLPEQPEHLAGLAGEARLRSPRRPDRGGWRSGLERRERGRPLDGIVDGASREPRVRLLDERSAFTPCPRQTAIWSSRADLIGADSGHLYRAPSSAPSAVPRVYRVSSIPVSELRSRLIQQSVTGNVVLADNDAKPAAVVMLIGALHRTARRIRNSSPPKVSVR